MDKGVFADVFKDYKMRSSSIFWVDSKFSVKCPNNRRRHAQRGPSGNQAETGVMPSCAGNCLGPLEAGGGKEGFSSGYLEGAEPCRHLDFGLLASRTVREYVSVATGHKVCGNL